MPSDSIINLDPIPVVFVSGETGEPISVQAPAAFSTLEGSLASLRGRKFYGTVIGSEYRACLAVNPEDETDYGFPRWSIPGGRYLRRRLPGGHEQPELIATAAEDLCSREDYDSTRPVIEFYRSRDEVVLMAPVR